MFLQDINQLNNVVEKTIKLFSQDIFSLFLKITKKFCTKKLTKTIASVVS